LVEENIDLLLQHAASQGKELQTETSDQANNLFVETEY